MGLSSVLVRARAAALWSDGGGPALDPVVVWRLPAIFAANQVERECGSGIWRAPGG